MINGEDKFWKSLQEVGISSPGNKGTTVYKNSSARTVSSGIPGEDQFWETLGKDRISRPKESADERFQRERTERILSEHRVDSPVYRANSFVDSYNKFIDDVDSSGYTPDNVKSLRSIQMEYENVSDLFNQEDRKRIQDHLSSLTDYFGGFTGKLSSIQFPEQIDYRRAELQKSYQDALDEAIEANPGVSLHNLPVTDDMKYIRSEMDALDEFEENFTKNKHQETASSPSEDPASFSDPDRIASRQEENEKSFQNANTPSTDDMESTLEQMDEAEREKESTGRNGGFRYDPNYDRSFSPFLTDGYTEYAPSITEPGKTELELAKEEYEAAFVQYQIAEENYYSVPDGDFQKAQDDFLAADTRLSEAEARVKKAEEDLLAQEDMDTFNKYQEMIAALPEQDLIALWNTNGRYSSMAYGYLLQKGYSSDDINAMYETLQRVKNAAISDHVIGAVYDYAGQNFGTGVVGFTGARAGNIVGGVTGTFQAIHDTAQHYFQGSPYHTTDPNGLGYLPSRAAAAADQGASDAIEGEDGGFLRQAAAFVYRGAANAADNLTRMAVAAATGGGAIAGAGINSALSFTQGFQSSYREAQEKGGSPIQGLLVGAVDGGMEVFTESRTFERWMHMKDPEQIGQGVYAWLKSTAVGIGNEIKEEEASYIANTIADAVVMANRSENARFIQAAVAEGKTYEEAKWELVKKYAHEMAVTAADTAMSTLLMDAGTGVVANYQENRRYKETYGEVSQELVQEGIESPEGTQSRTLAEKAQQKLDAGKELSGSELRRLVIANEAQFLEEDNGFTVTKGDLYTEIRFKEDPSQEIMDALEDNGFTYRDANNTWYGRKSTEEARRIVLENSADESGDAGQPSLGASDTTEESNEPASDVVSDLDANQEEEEIVADSEMETTTEKPEKTVTLESLSEKYGPYAEAMRGNYLEGQDAEEYDREFQIAYDIGKSGLNKSALSRVEALNGLTYSQREIAYEIGEAAAAAQAKAQSAENAEAANGKTGWHKGVVMGKGVKIADLTKEFNDPQRKAYSALSTIAEATGIDIVLYKSQANDDGTLPPVQGTFVWSENTIYIDVNAGLSTTKDVGSLAKYTMLRTYGHEFTHFIEKWNPEQYNEFRKAVFDTMKNPEDLIETVLSQDSTGKMSYDDASREVVAQAMTDILEDSQFIQQLADKHRSVFETLRSKLKEFVENLKSYFKSLARNGLREARLLKKEVGDSISYLEDIVKRFDEAAVQAVENYQRTVAEDNTESETMEEASAPSEQKETEASFEEVFWNATPEERKEVVDAIDENMGGPTRMYPTELPALEQEETVSENAIEAPSISQYDGFSVTTNTERGTLEIRFDSKPGQNVLNLLKENKFRWSSKNKLWYGKADQSEISKRISDAMNAAENSSSQEPVAENNQLTENPAVNNTEEVTQNAETDVRGQEESNGALWEDHQGGIPESEQPGEGNPRLLDEVEAEPVQQHEQGGAAGVPGERGTEAGRSGSGPDSERDGRSGSAGSGAVSDLRRDADVNQDDGGIAETVQREIEQKSTEKPKGENYSIGESLNLAKGEKARYRDNVSALRLIHQLNQEGRFATREEQEVLSRYVGWGGLDGAFGELGYNRETRKSEMRAKSGWEKEFQELRQLVTDGIISEEEYRGMSESTKNAHYTSMEVISAMYDGLKKLGFQGGRMLEPSSGVGNFVGGMPADMTSSVKSWTMVELDRVTGQIAKYLYPNNDVRIEGFQDANIPNDYMDVAIGNVPFGNYGVVDRSYPKRVTKSIHNYFFAKSMDKVRPGGLVMFITSSFTMNSQDNAIRQYLMDRADLLGAIRLPNTAFKGNAGTDVVTDILILKKRIPGTAYSGETFLEAPQKSIPGSWRTVNVNEYFSAHPEMVLGKETVTRGMYGAETLTYAPLEGAVSLGDQIRAAFDKITVKMDYTQKTAESVQKAAEKAVRKPKEGVYRRAQDGTITNGSGVAVTNADTAKRIGGMIDIRDAYRNLVERIQQGRTKEEIAKARKYLNQVYDSFVKENGLINDPKNKKAFEEDPYRFSVFALETDYQKGGKGKPSTAKKADIFTKDTIKANVTVTHAESVSDGLIVSINTTGGVDASLIARLTGRSKEEVTRELIDSRMAFKTRNGGLEAPETYLSGNVRAKLREAEALARNDKDFQNNVEELRRVIPKDVPYDEIHVSPGAVWVPTDVYADFIAHMLGGRNNGYGGPDVEVGYSAQTGEYKIRLNNARLKGNYHNTQEWGTSRRSFLDLFESLLGNGNVTVTDREIDANGKERRVVNKDETAAAQEKADKIKEEFRNWIWSDETRRTELSKLYNETYNALANPKYDGSSLTVNGLNATFSLREHQANAVKRIIASGGNTLLAHRVGAGKTLEMAAAAMKLRELGIVKKPVFAVPKSLVAQWGVEFNSYFPAAKLLVADDKSFSKENRKVFTNNIANGDFDAVILSYEQFGKIPMSKEYQQRFLQEQIDEVLDAIAEEKAENGEKSLTVKQMEKKVAQLKTKLERLKIQSVDENNVDFESLGIDALFVDEAHNFKNCAKRCA